MFKTLDVFREKKMHANKEGWLDKRWLVQKKRKAFKKK